jgi:hypothetical protein
MPRRSTPQHHSTALKCTTAQMTASRAAGNAGPSLLETKQLHVDTHLRSGQCIEPRFWQQSSCCAARHLGRLCPTQSDLTGCTRHLDMHAHLYNKAVCPETVAPSSCCIAQKLRRCNVSSQQPTLGNCAPHPQPAEPKPRPLHSQAITEQWLQHKVHRTIFLKT